MASKGRRSQGYSKDDWERQAWDKAREPGSWPASREWSVRLLPSGRRTPPGLNGKGEAQKVPKGGKGKSKGKEREEIYDWKTDRQGISKGSSKGKGKDGYGSGKGKESGSTSYGFDSGKGKGDGKGKARKGKERSNETGWATAALVAKPLGPIGSAHPSEPVMRQGQGPSDRQAMPVGARPQDYLKKPPLRARPKAAAESKRLVRARSGKLVKGRENETALRAQVIGSRDSRRKNWVEAGGVGGLLGQMQKRWALLNPVSI
eukprot:s2549_g9.t1